MKNAFNFAAASLLLLPLLQGCFVGSSFVRKSATVTISNPSDIERADELVVFTRSEIQKKLGDLDDNRLINIMVNRQAQVVQHDDLNRDGKWDEVAFLLHLEPRQTLQLTLSAVRRKPAAGVQSRAHVRMRKKNPDNTFGPLLDSVSVGKATPPTDFTQQKLPPYLTEGPAWESDKVAFRVYMDTRNTKDIFGKRTSTLMMDTVGVLPENSYHHLSDWGMDILAVGKSLGAGGIALRIPQGSRDTLVRVGGPNVGRTTFLRIADGPVRAIFKMQYQQWQVLPGLPPIDVEEEISIWGGKYFYQSKVTTSPLPAGAAVVTGIVNLKNMTARQLEAPATRVLYTFGRQSESNDHLGMAVAVPATQWIDFGATPNSGSDVLNTYTALLRAAQPAIFRFYAGWELSDLLFTDEDHFKVYLQHEATKWGVPVVVSW